MPLLLAKFRLNVSSPCLITWPEGEIPSVVATFGEFDVVVKLVPMSSSRSMEEGDIYWTTELGGLEIDVSRDESESPPEAVVKPDGRIDLIAQGEYLRSKLPEYRTIAADAANRILRYFQYSLRTPLVRQIAKWDQSLHNPTWLDSRKNELRGGAFTFLVPPVPGLRGELGARKLTPEALPDLQSFFKTPTEPSLAATLLSDSQAAWFEDNLRRAVLELAICTEIVVKRRFFAQTSPAGAAFDYLEDKAKVSVRVLDFIDSIAEEAFAESYRKKKPQNYEKIDHLFRCRNKIAHRGELAFRDDSGTAIRPDAPMVEGWWHAVDDLMIWLQSLR